MRVFVQNVASSVVFVTMPKVKRIRSRQKNARRVKSKNNLFDIVKKDKYLFNASEAFTFKSLKNSQKISNSFGDQDNSPAVSNGKRQSNDLSKYFKKSFRHYDRSIDKFKRSRLLKQWQQHQLKSRTDILDSSMKRINKTRVPNKGAGFKGVKTRVYGTEAESQVQLSDFDFYSNSGRKRLSIAKYNTNQSNSKQLHKKTIETDEVRNLKVSNKIPPPKSSNPEHSSNARVIETRPKPHSNTHNTSERSKLLHMVSNPKVFSSNADLNSNNQNIFKEKVKSVERKLNAFKYRSSHGQLSSPTSVKNFDKITRNSRNFNSSNQNEINPKEKIQDKNTEYQRIADSSIITQHSDKMTKNTMSYQSQTPERSSVEYRKIPSGNFNAINDEMREITNEGQKMRVKLRDAQCEYEQMKEKLISIEGHYETVRQELAIHNCLKDGLQSNEIEKNVAEKSLMHAANELKNEIERHTRHVKSEEYQEIDKNLDAVTEVFQKDKQLAVCLEMEIKELKKKIHYQNKTIKNFSRIRRTERSKDIQMKLLRNEIIELSGNLRAYIRLLSGPTIDYEPLDNKSLLVQNMTKANNERCFVFDGVYHVDNFFDQARSEFEPLITASIDGYNVGIVSLNTEPLGPMGKAFENTFHSLQGIIEPALKYILDVCSHRHQWMFRITVSALQVFSENVFDILQQPPTAVFLKDNGKSLDIPGLKERQIDNFEGALQCIQDMFTNKRDCDNRRLSFDADAAGHFFVFARIRGKSSLFDSVTHGMLILCELNRKLSNEENSTKTDYDTFQNVIEALEFSDRNIPFRKSNFTHLLKPCLTGDAKCAMVLSIDPLMEEARVIHEMLYFGSKVMKLKKARPVFGHGKAIKIYR